MSLRNRGQGRFSYDTLCGAKRPTAPPLGELLSECEAERVRYDICNMPKVTHDTPSVSPFGLPAFNSGMIATGNHNFEGFAALCNTPEVEPRALRVMMRLLNCGCFNQELVLKDIFCIRVRDNSLFRSIRVRNENDK